MSTRRPPSPRPRRGRIDEENAQLRRTVIGGHAEHAAGQAERTLALAVLRGALLDLLATNDVDRTTAAVERHLAMIRQAV